MTFKAAKCPECGADIQVPSDRDAVKCMYCGKDIIVRQAVQAVAGPSALNWVKLAAAAAEAGNHDEAYRYFTQVLEVEPENHEAWFGKAVAAGWGSGLNSDRFNELLAGIERAIEYAPDTAKNDLRVRGADVASDISVAYFKLSVAHTKEYIALDDTWNEHIARCFPLLTLLEIANTFDPTNKHVVTNGIYLAKSLIEGVVYNDPYDTYDNGTPKRKTKHLTENLEARAQQAMDEFVAKMKAMDASYVAPTIEKASTGMGAVLGCMALLVLLAASAWFVWGRTSGETRAPTAPVETARIAESTGKVEAHPEAECTQWETTCKLADGVTPGGSQQFNTKGECESVGLSTFGGVQLFHCESCRCSARGPAVAVTTPAGAHSVSSNPPAYGGETGVAPGDEGFVDTRGGAGWGDRCWTHLKAGHFGWAKAECDKAMDMNPASPQPRASLLYNEGLIEQKLGHVDAARVFYQQSLALRPNADVQAALDSVQTSVPAGRLHAAHVLVQWAGSTDSKQRRSKADALARAQEAKAKLDAGEDFAAVALTYDDDAARTRGGDLGMFSPGTFPKPFEAAATRLDVGGVSDIVETSFGFHIIKRLP